MTLTERAIDRILAEYRTRERTGIQLAINGDHVPPAPPDWLPLRQQLQQRDDQLDAGEHRLLVKMWNDRRIVAGATGLTAVTLLTLLVVHP